MKTITIKLDSITIDSVIQPRALSLDQAHVAELTEAVEAGATLPPPVVFTQDDEAFILSEGFHRCEVYKRKGTKEIIVEVRQGDRNAAILNAMASNQSHGLKRTHADKRRAVTQTLKIVPEWSDRKIAEHLGVNNTFVGDVRREVHPDVSINDTLQAAREVEKRTGRDGKQYTAKPKAESKPKPTQAIAPTPAASTPEPVNEPETSSAESEPANTTEQEAASEEPDNESADEVFCKTINRICLDIDEIIRRANELKASPYSRFVMIQPATIQLKNARETLWGGRPTHECPYCAVAGEPQPSCRCCGGLNVTTKSNHKAGEASVGVRK